MNLIANLKKEFSKPENKNKFKTSIIASLIVAPLLVLYGEYWINFIMDGSAYFLSLRPPLEELASIEIAYWIFHALFILLGGLIIPIWLIMQVTETITNFVAFRMKWAKRKSQCTSCSVRLKENDTILFKNGKAYHYSCFSDFEGLK